MKFLEEDNGNCRVYYRENGRLYCYQLASTRPLRFEFYRCSQDGEPSYEVKPFDPPILPRGETSTGKQLITFLTSPAASEAT